MKWLRILVRLRRIVERLFPPPPPSIDDLRIEQMRRELAWNESGRQPHLFVNNDEFMWVVAGSYLKRLCRICGEEAKFHPQINIRGFVPCGSLGEFAGTNQGQTEFARYDENGDIVGAVKIGTYVADRVIRLPVNGVSEKIAAKTENCV